MRELVIVADDEATRSLLEGLLRLANLQGVQVADGEDALRQFSRHRSDLVDSAHAGRKPA